MEKHAVLDITTEIGCLNARISDLTGQHNILAYRSSCGLCGLSESATMADITPLMSRKELMLYLDGMSKALDILEQRETPIQLKF